MSPKVKPSRSHRDARRDQAIAEYLNGTLMPCLHFGAGTFCLHGWLNTDLDPKHPSILRLDLREELPFPDASFAYVAGEHVIEHIGFDHGRALLAECRRILRPGGRIRLATPDLARIMSLFSPSLDEAQKTYLAESSRLWLPNAPLVHPTLVLNNIMHNFGHVFLYTRDVLAFALEQAGFVDIQDFNVGQSRDPLLRGIEAHGQMIGEAINGFETMVLEAGVG